MLIISLTHTDETGASEYEEYADYADLSYRVDDYQARDLIESLYRYKPYLFKEIVGDCSEKD